MAGSRTWKEDVLDVVERHIPTTGYNVVAVDSIAIGDEPALYLVSHHDDRDAADAAAGGAFGRRRRDDGAR